MSTIVTPARTRDPRALAAELAERELPGRRSMTSITRLRRDRGRRRALTPTSPIQERVREHLLTSITNMIEDEGGETGIDTGDRIEPLEIQDRDITGRLTLVGVHGWRLYGSRSRGSHSFTGLVYLSGVGARGRWVVRVPATCTTVAQARSWSIPAEVPRIAQEGRRVLDQGKVFVVETTPAHTGKGAEHAEAADLHWRDETRYLVHRPTHGRRGAPLNLRGWSGVRFVPRKSLPMGR